MMISSKVKKGLLITSCSLLAAGLAILCKGLGLSDPSGNMSGSVDPFNGVTAQNSTSLSEANSASDKLYFNFLCGAGSAVAADWYQPDSGYSGAAKLKMGKKYTLDELTAIVTSDRFQEWQDGYKGEVEFALFDSENDGKNELAVRLNGVGIDGPEDSSATTFILKETDGTLLLCDAFDTWSRSESVQYYYGFREGGGSAGAGDHLYEAYFIDGNGHKILIYSVETLTGQWMEYASEDAARLYNNRYEGVWPEAAQIQIYTINGKEYYCYSTDTENRQKQENEEQMIAALITCFEEQGIRFSSAQEIEGLIDERERELEIEEEWLCRKELDWANHRLSSYSESENK